jgi:hypothetical protein
MSITLTASEAEAIARARAALAWIAADSFPWPSFGAGQIHAVADSLREALADHDALGAIPARAHPADLFPDLGRGQDNALELALDLVTQDIREWTGELCRLAEMAEEAARALEVAA